MVYKIIKFFGAIVVAILFCYVVDIFHMLLFGEVVFFFVDFSWSNWLSWDLLRGKWYGLALLRGLLLLIVWGIICLIGMALEWLTKESKTFAILPIIIFIFRIVNDFIVLFIQPIEPIVAEIGLGFWYYVGATITFIMILACYLICSLVMLSRRDS